MSNKLQVVELRQIGDVMVSTSVSVEYDDDSALGTLEAVNRLFRICRELHVTGHKGKMLPTEDDDGIHD